MNKKILYGLIIIIVCHLLSGCEKGDDKIKFFLDDFTIDKYYTDEILDDQYLDFYGKWELNSISGGFFGIGYQPNFNFLEIKEFGIYGFIRNDTLLEYGKIEIDEQNNIFLKIRFLPDNTVENIFFYDNEKYVELVKMDTLNLSSPCCDRYDYHFVRVK
ncbi:MAG: hypothetical protein AMS27_01305 [Bacteroides sp. SM23_62_1]|nr:MAG: hypothetical protein AMS27_01305 [Bacteroides sp. SM23_62_1]